jgi:O-antigen/teichoic acid export membrane protein/peptidoglycan/xylan/chitin deacetylase (PgdA/CDA1 family)
MKNISLSDQAVFLVGSRVVNSILSFGTGLLLVRYLTKQDYGTYIQIMLLGTSLATALQFGIPASIYYFFPKLSNSGKRAFLYQTFLMLLIFGLFGSLGIYIFRIQIGHSWMQNPELTRLSFYIMGYMVLMIIEQCSDPIFLSAGYAKLAALIEIIFSVFWISLIALPLLFHRGITEVIGMVVLLYALKTVCVLIFAFIFTREGKKRKMFSAVPLAEQSKYFYPLGLSSLSFTIGKGLDKFVIAHYLPAAGFAVYGRGAIELPLVGILPTTLSNLLLPKYIDYYEKNDSNSLVNLWHAATQKTALVILPVFVFALIMANPIITVLYTESYSDSVNIFQVYLCLLPFRITIFSTILKAIGRTKTILHGTWISLLSSFILCLLFYHFWGPLGPAIAVVASELLLGSYMLNQICKCLKVKLPQVLPWRILGKTFLVAAVAGCVILPIHNIPLPKMIILLGSGIIYLLFYIVLSKTFKIITDEDILFFKDWILLRKLGSDSVKSKKLFENTPANIGNFPFIKDCCIRAGYSCGYFSRHRTWRIKQSQLKSTLIILMYHHISNLSSLELSQGGYTEFDIGISQVNFEKQICHLKKNYPIFSFPEVLSMMAEKKPFPPNSIIITFDDAYADSYHNAFPILKNYNVPASIFMTTHIIDGPDLFWWDELGEIVRGASIEEFDTKKLQQLIGSNKSMANVVKLHSLKEKMTLIEQLICCFRNLPDYNHVKAIKLLYQQLIPKENKYTKTNSRRTSQVLTWPQIHEMELHDISFGWHSRYHENMNYLSLEEIDKMFSASKELIGQKINNPLSVFVYPSGKVTAQYESSREIFIKYDFKCALTDEFGIVNIYKDDLFSLPRIGLPNKGVAFLEKQFYTAYNHYLHMQEK